MQVKTTPGFPISDEDTSQTLKPYWKVLVAFGLLALYAFAQPWPERGYVSDVEAATIPAWHLVETGSWELSEFKDLNPLFVETRHGVRSNRSPGIIGFRGFGLRSYQASYGQVRKLAGIVMAVLVSWLAVLFMAATAERMRVGLWLLAGYLVRSWHSDLVCFSGATQPPWFRPVGDCDRTLVSGSAKRSTSRVGDGGGSLVRPPVVLLGVGLGVVKAVWDRSFRPLFTIGLPSFVAAILYLASNRILFGSWSPTAAYEAVGGFILVENRVWNVLAAFISPAHGVFIWSAWLAVGVVLLVTRRKHLPEYAWLVPFVAGIYVVIYSAFEIAGGGLPYNYCTPWNL